MKRVQMPPRTVPLAPGGPLARYQELSRSAGLQGARLALVDRDGAPAVPLRQEQQRGRTPSTIPPDVLDLVDARDGHMCVRCGRVRKVIEHHHRRIKGMGGSVADHTECPCCIVSVCPWWTESACHPWAHANRPEAEAEGLIIPRAAEFPWLYSVMVHSQHDGSGAKAWPTCRGAWTTDEPEGALT